MVLGGAGSGLAAAAGACRHRWLSNLKMVWQIAIRTASAGKETVKQLAFQKGAGAVGSLTGSGQSAQLGFTAAAGTVQNPMLEINL
jgi:hypothetical protein